MYKKTRGFTLIEVLVASSLTAIVIVWCVFLIASGSKQTQSILELDEIKSLNSSYKWCLKHDTQIRSRLSDVNVYNIYYDTNGCHINLYNGWTSTGNTIIYTIKPNPEPEIIQKKQEYIGLFRASTGSINWEITIQMKISGPTLHKEYWYSLFVK